MKWLYRRNNRFAPPPANQAGWDDIHEAPDAPDAESPALDGDRDRDVVLRRSSRKRGLNVDEVTRNPPAKKPGRDEAESDVSEWSNVKKMRKEFSKLSKLNKNKLNVSINMCKKAQGNKGDGNGDGVDIVRSKHDEENDRNVENTSHDASGDRDRRKLGHGRTVTADAQVHAASGHKRGDDHDVVAAHPKVKFFLKGKCQPALATKNKAKPRTPHMLKSNSPAASVDRRASSIRVEEKSNGIHISIDDFCSNIIITRKDNARSEHFANNKVMVDRAAQTSRWSGARTSRRGSATDCEDTDREGQDRTLTSQNLFTNKYLSDTESANLANIIINTSTNKSKASPNTSVSKIKGESLKKITNASMLQESVEKLNENNDNRSNTESDNLENVSRNIRASGTQEITQIRNSSISCFESFPNHWSGTSRERQNTIEVDVSDTESDILVNRSAPHSVSTSIYLIMSHTQTQLYTRSKWRLKSINRIS